MVLFNKLDKMTKGTMERTGGSWEIVKLNSLISAQNAMIAEQKSRLGDYYWNKIKNGEAYDPEVSEIVEGIRDGYEEIETTLSEIQELKAAIKRPTKCTECGNKNPRGLKFCQSCGSELKKPSPIPEEAPPSIICPDCGADCSFDANFCGMCGTHLERDEYEPDLDSDYTSEYEDEYPEETKADTTEPAKLTQQEHGI